MAEHAFVPSQDGSDTFYCRWCRTRISAAEHATKHYGGGNKECSLRDRNKWEITVTLEDGTGTWVTRSAYITAIYDSEGRRPHIEEAAGEAFGAFIRSVVRDEEALRDRWEAAADSSSS